MTKRNLLVLTAVCAMTASNAFASRARLLSMGTGDGQTIVGNGESAASSGSLFYDDAYNMFQNPAAVNDYKNWAIIEKSNYAGATLHGAQFAGSSATAQGGFVTSIMNFNMGLYLNRIEAVSGSYATTSAAGARGMTPIDLVFGGDMMDVKWGLGLTYASFTNQNVVTNPTLTKRTSADVTLRLGAAMMGFEPYVSYKLVGADLLNTANQNTFTNKHFGLGMKYRMGEWTPYVHYRNDSVTAPSGDKRVWNNSWGIGFGRTTATSENSRLIYGAGFFNNSASDSMASAVSGTGTPTGARRSLPINVAVEADVLSWLSARAGLSYRLINQKNAVVNQGGAANMFIATSEWETVSGDPVVGRVGATIHAGKADIDFAAGTSSGAGAPLGEEAGSADTDTLGLGAGLFTAMSLSYKW